MNARKWNKVSVHCKRCNRTLKKPESIQRGYGQICWNKIQGTQEKIEHKEPTLEETLFKE